MSRTSVICLNFFTQTGAMCAFDECSEIMWFEVLFWYVCVGLSSDLRLSVMMRAIAFFGQWVHFLLSAPMPGFGIVMLV